MAVTIKKRKPGELSRRQAVTKKIVDSFGMDLKSQRTAEQKRAFTYKLPEQVFKDYLCAELGISLSALNVRIRAHKIPPPDGKDGRHTFWYRGTIESYRDETTAQRTDRVNRARAAVRQRAAEKYAAEGGASKRAAAEAIVEARIAAIPREADTPDKPRRARHLRIIDKY